VKTSYKFAIALSVFLILFILWLINMDIIALNNNVKQQTTALEEAGNDCVAISEKSVSHMTAVVEFQKLEIIGRKARVMRNCMDDHGYIQNPAWTAYATPVAEKTASIEKISVDEAFESFRRQAMVTFTTTDNKPLYWIKPDKK
jgi:hypothetical protein